ncbi:glycoside hydrolase family 27 protein, partial [Glonium stellatum]
YETTPNGFNTPPRGWNSFGLQGRKGITYNQDFVIEQCDAMAAKLGSYGYIYCSLDSGWSMGTSGDDYGRIIGNSTIFGMTALADHLHGKGLELGVYVVPGYFESDGDKYIYGTDPPIQLSTIGTGHNNGLSRIDINITAPGAQEWCNSVIDLFASWGVDFIKLDYITPGSPDNGANLAPDTSGNVICYHRAISQCGRQMRLDISWKLDYVDSDYYDIWKTNADSMRIDQDINNSGGSKTFTAWETVQRTIEQYREYILVQDSRGVPLTIYPDMDNLYVGNAASLTGLTDDQRRLVVTHWVGAGANLILGSDMTQLDKLGLSLLTNPRILDVADFTAKYPMTPKFGDDLTKGPQAQLWLAGPDPDTGIAVIALVNYG